jgi:hypothetical protein
VRVEPAPNPQAFGRLWAELIERRAAPHRAGCGGRVSDRHQTSSSW